MFTSSLLGEYIPLVQTRQALLIIDLQNDFLSVDSKLSVGTGSGFVGNIKNLAPVFRQTGDVIWVRTEFGEERSINDGQGVADTVITDADIPDTDVAGNSNTEDDQNQAMDTECLPGPAQPPKRAMELSRRISASNLATSGDPDSEEDADNETFLTRSKCGKAPNCCKPDTVGSRFVDDILPAMDYEKDTMVVKSHYSAFKSDSLLFTLRGKLVTELYICGSLSNISVYATALDAARHGFSITILEDCVGYRDYARHQEAMRQMADIMGADGLTSTEYIIDFEKEQERKLKREARSKRRSKGHSDRRIKPKMRERVPKSPPALSPEAGATEPFPTLEDGSSLDDVDYASRARIEEPYDQEQQVAALERPQKGLPKSGIEKTPSMISAIEVDTASDQESQRLDATFKITRTRRQISSKDPISNYLPETSRGDKSHPRQPKPVCVRDIPLLRSRPVSGTEVNEETPDFPSMRAPTPTPNVVNTVSASLETIAFGDASDQPRPTSNETAPLPTTNNDPTVKRPFVKKEKQIKRAAVGPMAPTLGPSETIGEGDSRIMQDLLPPPLAENVFELVKAEVQWHTMSHRGSEVPRLVAVEGEVDADGSVPIYRHPADESPPLRSFSPAVSAIRDEVQKVLKHPVNHVLIQLYRGGKDNISEHSDKTLDIVRGSNIVNVSLGAQRTMTLRTKKSAHAPTSSSDPQRQQRPTTQRKPSSEGIPQQRHHPPSPNSKTGKHSQRITLPHNSMFILGQQTNMRWLHAIRADKRLVSEKSVDETAFGGERISLTFRHIGTFLNENSNIIWGQGAASEEKAKAGKIVRSRSEAERCLQAFGMENHSSEFDWDGEYGAGFNIIGMNPTRPKLILNDDGIAELQVKLCLRELGISCDEEEGGDNNELRPPQTNLANDTTNSTDTQTSSPSKIHQRMASARRIQYIDPDAENEVVEGVLPILIYLDKFNTFPSSTTSTNLNDTSPSPPPTRRAEHARILARAFRTVSLLELFSNSTHHQSQQQNASTNKDLAQRADLMMAELATWNSWAEEGTYIAGNHHFSIADCAFWPVLKSIMKGPDGYELGHEKGGGGLGKGEFDALRRYYIRIEERNGDRRR
ncbi:MAG: hypothetical protein M1835_006064 [Candelina submexicana]|nr:MAG: hypothetical protein M1835_006064 [Candelina submexicana]